MKFLKVLLLSFLTVACGQNKKEAASSAESATADAITDKNNGFSITEVEKAVFDQTLDENRQTLQADTTYIRKRGGMIVLPIKVHTRGDSTLMFQDKVNTDNEEEDITYQYRGYYETIDRHLLETHDYETIGYDLISKKGKKTPLWSKPIFSNDKNYFACIMPYRLEGEPVGLQIWRVRKDPSNSYEPIQLEMILELNQLMFNPLECIWDKSGALIIKAEKIEDNFYPKEPSEVYYLKLEYK